MTTVPNRSKTGFIANVASKHLIVEQVTINIREVQNRIGNGIGIIFERFQDKNKAFLVCGYQSSKISNLIITPLKIANFLKGCVI